MVEEYRAVGLVEVGRKEHGGIVVEPPRREASGDRNRLDGTSEDAVQVPDTVYVDGGVPQSVPGQERATDQDDGSLCFLLRECVSELEDDRTDCLTVQRSAVGHWPDRHRLAVGR